jgi:hypothetical protein
MDKETNMISFNTLGYFGKLGNQMFQYACLYSIAKKNGYDFCIPSFNYELKIPETRINVNGMRLNLWYKSRLFLKDMFNISAKESDFKSHNNLYYDSDYFNEKILSIPDNTDIMGYFQSEKYFIHCAEDIRKEFTFKNQEKFNKHNSYMKSLPIKIGLHIRRGDYLRLSNIHTPCSREYYINALNSLISNSPKDVVLYVFSDDIKWCKQNIASIFDGDIIFDDETDNEENYHQHQEDSLMKMTLCDKFITANSSFSWWGAWLGKNTNVIAPKIWVAGNYNPNYHAMGWKIL